jgi:hypothetical protein
MTRIYRRRTLKLRFWAALVVLFAFGVVSLRLNHAVMGTDHEEAMEWLVRFAAFAPAAFVALALAVLIRSLWRTVGAFEIDRGTGRFRLWLWRPLGWRMIDGTLNDIAHWRYERRRLSRAIVARLDAPPTELRFEIRRHRDVDPVWRRIAPGAVAAYERDTGLRVGG